MTTITAVRPLAILGTGLVSPAGVGLEALAGVIAEPGRACADQSVLTAPEVLPEPVRAVPELRLADYVGRKGTRHLDRTTALGLAAGHLVLRTVPGDDLADVDVGVVIGSSAGSLRSIGEFSRDTLTEDEPYLVDAAKFPNTVMNCCAGQIAIWNGLRGVNATVAGGHLSTLYAIRYGRNAVATGQVRRVLVGGVEELCAQTAWGWRAAELIEPGMPVGEGCALFAVEDGAVADAARRPYEAELLACEIESPGPARTRTAMADRLERVLSRALARSGADASEIALVAPGATGLRVLAEAEERALTAVAGDVPRIRVRDGVGECFSASGALQIAAVLAHWRTTSAPGGRIAVVTSAGPDGAAGALVMRRAGKGAADV